MGDRIASFLFERAIVLAPAVVIRPSAPAPDVGRDAQRFRVSASHGDCPRTATLASGLLHAERTICAILQQGRHVISAAAERSSRPAHVRDLQGDVVVLNSKT